MTISYFIALVAKITLLLVTMGSKGRSILLKSIKGSHLCAFTKKTEWNPKATNEFSANSKLKPMSLYYRTYDVSLKLVLRSELLLNKTSLTIKDQVL